MMPAFDAYYKWLGIPPRDQPPHYYRLLGLDPFESDLEVIAAAADRQMTFVQQCATGDHVAESQQLLNELSRARVCLLNPQQKQAYDQILQKRLAPAAKTAASAPAASRRAAPSAEAALVRVRRMRLLSRALWAGCAALLSIAVLILVTSSSGSDDPPVLPEDQQARASGATARIRNPGGAPQNPAVALAAAGKPGDDDPDGRDQRGEIAANAVGAVPIEAPRPSVAEELAAAPATPAVPEPERSGPPDSRPPVPDADALDSAIRTVRHVFRDEFARADRAPAKTELALKLMNAGAGTRDDPAARYALFDVARDLAIEAGHIETALTAAEKIAAVFRVDPLEERQRTFDRLAAALRFGSSASRLVEIALNTVDEAVAADRFDVALALLEISSELATKFRERGLERSVEEKLVDVRRLHAEFEAAHAAAATLARDPRDPQANYVRGRYLAFLRNDWPDALPLLARGGEPALQALAAQELAPPSTVDQMAAVADGWWDAAQAHSGAGGDRAVMLARAAYWYDRAVPQLSGLTRAKVEKRLEALEDYLPAAWEQTAIQPASQPDRQDAERAADDRPATNDNPAVAVWEITAHGKTWPVPCFRDGTTHEKEPWSLENGLFSFGYDSRGTLDRDGLSVIGRWKRGEFFGGRLLMRNIVLATAPRSGGPRTPDASKTFVGQWELFGTAPGQKLLRLSLDFIDTGEVLFGGQKVARWTSRGGALQLEFIDPGLGEATFSSRSTDELSGSAGQRGADRWRLTLTRIRPVDVWDTDQLKRVTLHSNGRINHPLGAGGGGYWWLNNHTLRLGEFTCTVFSDGTFSGRDLYGTEILGTRVPASAPMPGRD